MKKHLHVFSIALLVVLGLLAWCLLEKRQGKPDENHEKSGKTARSREFVHTSSADPSARLEEHLRAWENEAVPVDFYGRVVGPDGKGVPGVEVSWRAGITGPRASWGPDGKARKTGVCATGPDGRFEFHAGRGYDIDINSLSKPGWRWTREEWGTLYVGGPEPHRPDLARPVEFLMVPENAPRPKEILNKRLSFRWNLGPVRFPINENVGVLVLEPKRNKKPNSIRDFSWSLTISMEGATLCEINNTPSPLAPKNGYEKQFRYEFPENKPGWKSGLSKSFAFKTNDGLYGLIRFRLYSDRDFGDVQARLTVSFNETGARNLE